MRTLRLVLFVGMCLSLTRTAIGAPISVEIPETALGIGWNQTSDGFPGCPIVCQLFQTTFHDVTVVFDDGTRELFSMRTSFDGPILGGSIYSITFFPRSPTPGRLSVESNQVLALGDSSIGPVTLLSLDDLQVFDPTQFIYTLGDVNYILPAATPTAVPEPSSLLLFAAGAAGLMNSRRRRGHRVQ